MGEPASSTHRTLIGGRQVRSGTESTYRELAVAPGEPHGVRADLQPDGRVRPGRTLMRMAHLTDLHIADTQSPLRLDFAARTAAERPGWGGAVTYSFRPHELLTAHAVAAMAGTLSRLGLDIAVVTGDNVDNVQANEIATYLDALDGGMVHPVSAGGVYTGPQHPDWNDPWYWIPDHQHGRYQRLWGYPTLAGLTDAASGAFRSPGLDLPWLACLGNHDVLVGGTTAASAGLSAIATASRKAVALPEDLAPGRELEIYLTEPARLFGGEHREVKPDPQRALLSVAEYVGAHLDRPAGPGPRGRGFTEANRSANTAYYRYDPVPGVRVFVLDTNHRAGMWDGNIDQAQLEWLADQLRVLRGQDDPVAILASHHGTPSMGNAYGVCPDTAGAVAFAGQLLDIALSCPNVVLWLNGHHHAHRVVAHHRPGGGGLYEVTTTSMTDFPTQARVLELVRQDDGVVRISSTVYDHDTPLVPEPGIEPTAATLAALHRELAANEVWRGAARQGLGGTPVDRNVHLLVPPG